MRFTDLLNTNTKQENIEESFVEQKPSIVESNEKPEELLRKAGFKIKLVTKTSFGVQIDFAKMYEKEDIEKTLKDFNIKIKDKSVFVVD